MSSHVWPKWWTCGPIPYITPSADDLVITAYEAQTATAYVQFAFGGAPCLAQEPLSNLVELREGFSTFTDAEQLRSAATRMWLLDFTQR